MNRLTIFFLILTSFIFDAKAVKCVNPSSGVVADFTYTCPVWMRSISPEEKILPPSVLSNPPTAAIHPEPTHSSIPAISGIHFIKDGGTFKVLVLINGIISLFFTVDSGASDVIIPSDVVLTLMRTGTITQDDFLGNQTYRLADGSTIQSKTFRIRQLKVGDHIVQNVQGSIADVKGSLLLGQSFLSRFKRVSFDYSQSVLILE